MSKYWDNFYAQRDRDNTNYNNKISINDIKVKGIVVVKKQITTTNNIANQIKGFFNER